MSFDVPKVVRSSRYDHGHNEESRNGRDIKIDILDDYVRAPERSRKVSDIYRSTGGLPEPPGEYIGPNGPWWEMRRGGQGSRAPSPSSPNWTRRGAVPPFPSPSLLLPSLLLLLLEGLES